MVFQDQTAYSAAIGALQTNPGIRRQARALQAQMAPDAELCARDYIAEVLAENCT
jgi:hypothetical protein